MRNLILDNTNCPVNAFSFVKEAVDHISNSELGSRAWSRRYTTVWNRIETAMRNGLDIVTANLIKTQINEVEEDVRKGIEL